MIKLADDEIYIMSGALSEGIWKLSGKQFRMKREQFDAATINYCEVVSDIHTTEQTGRGRIAGGILGAAVAGPFGALAGLMTGGKRQTDETIVLCTLFDGRDFKAGCTQAGAARLKILAINNREQSNSSASSSKPSESTHRSTTASTAQEKECPQCAEIVKARARLCRFCGFTFDASTDLFLDAQYMSFLNNFNATLSERGVAAAQISADGLIRTYKVLKEIQDGLGSISPKYTIKRQLHHVAWLFENRCEDGDDTSGVKNADDILLGTPLSRGEFVSYVLEIEDDDDDPDIEGEYDDLISTIADKVMGPETLNAWAQERELNSSLGIALGTVHDGIVEKQGYPVHVRTLAGRRGLLASYEDSQSSENWLTSEKSESLSDGQLVKVRVRVIRKNGGIVFTLLTPLDC